MNEIRIVSVYLVLGETISLNEVVHDIDGNNYLVLQILEVGHGNYVKFVGSKIN